ncbi:MAG: hypothetical protein WCQ96_04160 [Patescibacteria group bacterium]
MEDEKKQATVYVAENDEIVEIIDKIKNVPEGNVTLVISPESVILQDMTNLKILQKKAESIGKEISISKAGILGSDSLPSSLVRTSSSLPDVSSKPQERVLRAQTVAHGAVGATRPMSDMVKKGETVDLRNFNREKITEQPKVADETAEGYAREKYFSDEVLSANEKKTDEPVFEETELPLMDETDRERDPLSGQAGEETEDEIYWEKLAEKKLAEKGGKSESVFGDRGQFASEYDAKNFDFSYQDTKKTKFGKKKSSILPTISSRFFAIFILGCVLTAGLALFFILPKADIAVALKEEKVSGDLTLILDEKLTAIDADAGKIPVKVTEIKSEKTQSFATTSKKRVTEKATGNIVIYNECSTGPQTLVSGTRFQSKDGKIFKITAAANIAGFTKPEDDVVAGKETVKVVAEDAGESYNIAATSFTIPKLQEQGSWKYSCLYARSEQAMAGGLDKEVLFVSQADYDKAKETLLASVQKENDDKVSGQTGDGAIFLDNKTNTGTVEAKSSVAVDGVADSFDMTLSVKKSALSIEKKDVAEIAGKKIFALNTFVNAKPVDSSLDYKVGDLIDKDKQLSVNVSASQNFAFELDQEKVKKEIAGKNKQELNDYFAKMSGIKSVSVNFWPFWVNRVPESFDKIDIKVTSGV